MISRIVFSLVKCHHRLPFKINCWYQQLSFWYQQLSFWYQQLSSWYQKLSSWYQQLSSWYQQLSSWYQQLSSWYQEFLFGYVHSNDFLFGYVHNLTTSAALYECVWRRRQSTEPKRERHILLPSHENKTLL